MPTVAAPARGVPRRRHGPGRRPLGRRAAASSASASSDDASASRCSRDTDFSGGQIVEIAAEPGDDDLGRLRPRDRVRGLAGRFGLERGEAAQLGAELACLLRADREARCERLLEARRSTLGATESGLEPGCDVHEPTEERRIDVALAQVRDDREGLLCCDSCLVLPRLAAWAALDARPESSSASSASARRRASISSSTASAVSPANQSSPRSAS